MACLSPTSIYCPSGHDPKYPHVNAPIVVPCMSHDCLGFQQTGNLFSGKVTFPSVYSISFARPLFSYFSIHVAHISQSTFTTVPTYHERPLGKMRQSPQAHHPRKKAQSSLRTEAQRVLLGCALLVSSPAEAEKRGNNARSNIHLLTCRMNFYDKRW